MHKFTQALAAIGLAAVMSQSAMAETMKLGFLVKQPEEPWFQTEWKFADKAGKEMGFEVIKIAVPDGEKTLNAIDSLAASGAKGFVICTPDPKLGSAIVAKARSYDLKVIAVDDQFVTAKGKPMDSVPLVMMAATKIGERQGQELYKEMQKRGWDAKETGGNGDHRQRAGYRPSPHRRVDGCAEGCWIPGKTDLSDPNQIQRYSRRV